MMRATPQSKDSLRVLFELDADHKATQEANEHEDAAFLTNGQREAQQQQTLGSKITTKVKHATNEFKRIASKATNQEQRRLDRSNTTAAHALKGLQFVNQKVGSDGWAEVEKQFDLLVVDGLLLKSRFGKCIGMNEKEFARELFDALARKRGIVTETITKRQLRDFWEELSNQSFDARMRLYFDMVDKNADGQVTEEEVKQIILVSASANQLWRVKEKADEFAGLIMQALDPEGIGYIEVQNLETLFLQAPKKADNTEKLNKFLDTKLVVTKETDPVRRAVEKMYKHRYVYHVMGACVATAKGAAETLKFNMALILFPVCRKTVTWLRSRYFLNNTVVFKRI
ncbi:hypothetical protein KSS87_011910 [Heliosperma pusillum]|nr:hypothetical protein KSS87_011910 [Heliosperma pusillum]